MFALALAAIALSFPRQSPVLLEGVPCHPRRLLVQLETGLRPIELRKAGVRILRELPQIGYVIVETPKNRLQDSRRKLKGLRGVLRVDLDRSARPAYEPNDELWPEMWHMVAIKANLAWDHTFGSGNVSVAVIDTGVKLDHEDLAANIWVNADEVPGNSLDDDGNGYVDDVNGYDFAYNDPDPNDVYGHGTACAGLVAATQDNFVGVTGVAPRAKIMALKAAEDNGYFYDSATVPAYLYAADNGAQVLSMSFFSDRVSNAERLAIDYCWNHGVLPVAAAGNSSSIYPYYPAGYENTLSVCAVDANLRKAGFSNYGTWVDVGAPGVSLRTTSKNGGYTSNFAGTSGACPHVAGLAALLFGARPGVTVQEVRSAIEDTAVPLVQSPFGEFCNYGLIDCEAAALAVLGTPAPARDPVVRYLTMPGQQAGDYNYPDDIDLVSRIYGRGFQAPRQVRVTLGGIELPVLAQSRDWVDVALVAPQGGTILVFVDGLQVGQSTGPDVYRRCFSLVEASAPGASVFGGYFEALQQDSNQVRVTRRSDGIIRMQATFRKVNLRGNANLLVRRRYTSGAGTEKIYLYDWSSASYPYGTFVELSSLTTPTTMTTTTIPIADLSPFIDFEGTVYLLIETSDDMPSGAELRLDMAHIAERP